MSAIVLRIQSAEGVKRVNCKTSEKTSRFFEKIQEIFSRPGDFNLYKDRKKSTKIIRSETRTLQSFGLQHGDLLLIEWNEEQNQRDNGVNGTNQEKSYIDKSAPSIKEDNVDLELEKEDGRTLRPRNEQLCRHGPSGKCVHCVPLEPFDEEYLRNAEPPIKFLSFHSYLRKLRSGVDKGKFVMLENISCKIKAGCLEHPPWPGGICTKCQPNAVTLNRQSYRHVDYVQFENPEIMNRFLDYWRKSGNQRIGYLYGRYEQHKDVPLGIKAVVCAIYEPAQISSKQSVKLDPSDPLEATVENIASRLGLQRVGWIFTDLTAKDLQMGTVEHYRGTIDSFFLSAQECMLAATFQNAHPNKCRYARDNFFGSKFVTVVVTGDAGNQIHFEGYQVSNQCMALVRDGCFIPTIDAPELGYVKESSNEQYVPDVFYKLKDSFGNEVTSLARPLPVEYLLVDLQVAFPKEPSYTLNGGSNPFPIANRQSIGISQDFNAFTSYLDKYPSERLFDALNDLHLLIFLSNCDTIPLKDAIEELCNILKEKDMDKLGTWLAKEEWQTVETLRTAQAPTPLPNQSYVGRGPNAQPLPPIRSGQSDDNWACSHCTYHNTSASETCEMCLLPKQ